MVSPEKVLLQNKLIWVDVLVKTRNGGIHVNALSSNGKTTISDEHRKSNNIFVNLDHSDEHSKTNFFLVM